MKHSAMTKKILEINQMARVVSGLKNRGKKVVHCHGCFDLVHIGHIKYLQAASHMGDILVVTVTPDKYVKRGPGRPVFKEAHRAESLAALDCVDYVAINEWPTAVETIKLIKPDIYVKGSDFEGSATTDATGRLSLEEEAIKSTGGKIAFTSEEVFSSTKLLKEHFDILPNKLKQYLSEFTEKFNASDAEKAITGMKGLRVLVIGEPIIDEYNFCTLLQRASKATTVSTKFQATERYAGGALCIANHLSGFVKEVGLVGMLGEEDSYEKFIRGNLKPGVKFFPQFRNDGPTVIKRRFLEGVFNSKMFELCHFNSFPISEKDEKSLNSMLEKLLSKYDVIIAADFGHGFINHGTVQLLCKKSPYLVVMTQTNSANFGYNLITKYPRADYAVIDHQEIRLACHDQHGDIEPMVKRIARSLKCTQMNTTLGHEGALYYKNGNFFKVPAMAWKIVDTIGAGDAVLAITSPLSYTGVEPELSAFIGNCAGALAVQYLGNKEVIDRAELIKLIQSFLK